MSNRSLRMFIHILDDDSLLKVFYLFRPDILDEDKIYSNQFFKGAKWDHERWWYKFVHVCRRWRYLILGSASHLGLSLVCTRRTPVAVMLAHSPPLPLIVDHLYDYDHITTKDEENIMFALRHPDRVRRIRLKMPILDLRKIITAMDGEFPILAYLYIRPQEKDDTGLVLPQTFRAPHLRHLILGNFSLQMGSPLLIAVVSLVTLSLGWIHPSVYVPPNQLLHRHSLMPQLEVLKITFHSSVPSSDVRGQLLDAQIMTHAVLPHLRWFVFHGVSAYLDALLGRMTTPVLKVFDLWLPFQLSYSIQNLTQFVSVTRNLRGYIARLSFGHETTLAMYSSEWAKTSTFYVGVSCRRLDWQVSSMAQVSNTAAPVLSSVEYLTIGSGTHWVLLEGHNEVDRAQWNDLLRPFANVKMLQVHHDFVWDISNSLQLGDEESPIGLFPELKEIRYDEVTETRSAFATFIDARQNAGRPVTLNRP